MVFPAFFMGVAFPLAGKVYAEFKRRVGSAVGEVLAYNTVGAILGATISGFIMIYFFGIERSLQMLAIINIGFGLLVLFSLRNMKLLYIGVSSLTIGLLLFLGFNQSTFRIWDMRYFAIFRSNQPEAFRTPEMVREAIENTDVLYYGEGIETIVSTIKIKGGEQSFITNGRIEASSHLQGKQHLFALGHLPMLLHKSPKRILVVGLGAGITLGATSIHPSVEELTLVELEPKVIGVAKTFEKYNHSVLNNPKLKVVFNDGRNYLTTTKNKFDVITADPIHPWFRGAGYLYTTQYFKLASEHLNPGGVICQWLPIYEMTPDDLRSVVRTFHEHFKYTMLWLTLSDAEIIGSNTPIVIDESELERRIAESPILSDLKQVMMGSATDFLSYFVMGTEAMRNFSDGGVINTDDNLYLEFSAPFSIATRSVMEDNVYVLLKHSESILPYLTPEKSVKERISQEKKWASIYEAGKIGGPALASFLGGKAGTLEFKTYLEELDKKFPEYAPGRFLKSEYQTLLAMNPRLLQKLPLTFLNQEGRKIIIEISAVLVPVSKQRASIMFVDNQARVVYGQLYVWNYDKDEFVNRFVSKVLMGIQTTYQKEVESWMSRKGEVPLAEPTLRKIKDIITLIAKKYSPQEGNS
jgi:spermidine synthase